MPNEWFHDHLNTYELGQDFASQKQPRMSQATIVNSDRDLEQHCPTEVEMIRRVAAVQPRPVGKQYFLGEIDGQRSLDGRVYRVWSLLLTDAICLINIAVILY